ncbi:DUF2971 domain-containing protein [Leptospira barantonii]|nr:DUF2971 domain-containing protein [Leptospira barantonii]
MKNNKDKKIFRFMSFYSFVDLIQTQSLTLVRPKLWEDPYEGFIFRKLNSEQGKEEVAANLKSINTPERALFMNLGLRFENIFYAQSWTLCPESDAMWRIYNFDRKAIRVEVSESKMKQIEGLKLLYVDYKNEISLKETIKRLKIAKNKTDFIEAFKHKRSSFSHEQEVRIVYQDNEAINETMSDEEAIQMEKILASLGSNEKLTKKKFSDRIKVSFSNISDFIESVMLHPQSEEWFNDTLSEYCKINNLNYLGKSSLYKPL